MLADIVVDTNVFLHAENTEEIRQKTCRELIGFLTSCHTHLCIDEGFDLDEAKNKSHIGSEYLRHLRVGMIGYALVVHLAQTNRLKLLPRKVPQGVLKHLRQINKGPDRICVRVAFNSGDRTLASHDFNDMPITVRQRLRASIDVKIVTADEALAALTCQ